MKLNDILNEGFMSTEEQLYRELNQIKRMLMMLPNDEQKEQIKREDMQFYEAQQKLYELALGKITAERTESKCQKENIIRED